MREPSWRPGSPRRPAPDRAAKAPLTRAQLVRAGLRIVQTEGIDAVSMRRVASEFGTGPSSLYAHVTNKDELLQLMFDEMCGLIPVPALDPARWKQQIRELARTAHRVMVEHNDLAKAALATVPSGPNALRISDAMLGMMLAGGVEPRHAGWALDRLFLYVTADAYEHAIWRGQAEATDADQGTFLHELEEDLTAYYRELPAETYPNIHRFGHALLGGSRQERFEFGLDLLIDGFDRYVER